MSHEIEKVGDSYSFFSVNEVPWHGLGHLLNNPPTIAEGLRLAGLDWTVSKHPMYSDVEWCNPTTGLRHSTRLNCRTMAVVRDTDQKLLGEVGPKWTPLQNLKAFEWFDPFLKSGVASLETAGSLFGGARIFIMAKIQSDDDVIVPQCDDRVRRYILLSNGHDGLLTVRVGFSNQRVVCANTLAMAHNSNASKLLRVRHTKNMAEALVKIREIMDLANAEFTATADQYRFLASKQVVEEDLRKYLTLVFNPPKKQELPSAPSAPSEEEVKEDRRLMVNKVLPLMEEGLGSELPGVRGTVWGAYNAITQFLTWHRGRSQDERLNQLWFGGESYKINRRALELGVQLAQGNLT